ncbi:phenylacetic acid degradation protein paaN [Pseudarthrobacter chlorophenolicus A6]|uniref:Phenylacetic acid degradation protein paaN n=1 Tax=Pseudarthrobacter chlorophenolicus (strain ATCC 700700 / DSM 12829 / CIP 107037 / JCM 12360 / KCTC 9906 / NCIMB 13794 / A6) TaxID=452863 RepID=B8HF46_PSECP|nr:phenylacetic acid degradation bifunctional protein PaaZ [Pseudarthrobacter chlorophenolicus]ACL41014.1 phenylacetic acid degradation protein paaN [Pseudarthrobacter chlorophenolicus A6]SDQ71323.1 oxepin-CoA hydrolase / 3-oxo-5,6-dehydrosuberyl-CoA semialdehyde dehydrogenase [Pseudarthrobacter chlorophenolicus]
MTTTATAPHATLDTVETVPSFIMDSWWTPETGSAAATPVRDASTGELLAKVSTEGLDLAAAVEFGRTTGQAELGKLTFHQRALKLKELAQYLNARREHFYGFSYQTGATKIDSMVDIDGGIGVLFTFGSKGRRELPNSQVVVDGPMEVLSKDGSFAGEHIYTRIPGVAVQINAFNFPVWGMLEKFAPAFIAGVPTIVKPATPTGYVAAAVVKAIVESNILPKGSLQLVSGSVRGLLDVLDYRDLVSFTGSAATAKSLKAHPNVVEGGVRFTSETDSLNAAILGPDAVEGTPEFEAFVKSVVTEMTVKAGQKCTAIRRAIVPQELVPAVSAAIGKRIQERVVVGDPRAEGVTMGALASVEQLEDVRAAVQSMLDAGGELAYGTLDSPSVTSADGTTGVVDAGAFMAPVVLNWGNPEAEALHSLEAFGPVSSVVGYADLADAVRLAARGGGSLVASVCTNDPDVARELVTGIAAHHGRVLMLNREDARTSTGHGSPVPHLVHGGPGRAGGGEELGGIRSVLHHMQRTAIQGSPNMLTAVTGVWHTGADRNFTVDTEGTHPFRKHLETLRIGDAVRSDLRQVTLEDITAFANTTGDTFYAHTNQEAAEANPFFPGIVAHGYLLLAWGAGLFVEPAPGPVLANYGLENLRFITPVAAGDSIRVTLTAKKITPRETDEYGEVAWDAVLTNQDDEIVATYDVLTLVEK